MNHFERLANINLLHPLSEEEQYKRDRILDRVAEGEQIKDIPEFVVFRSDDEYRHIILPDEMCCRTAELIMQKLYHWEAARICDHLNYKDPDLPFRNEKRGYKQRLYKYSTMSEWERWLKSGQQMEIVI